MADAVAPVELCAASALVDGGVAVRFTAWDGRDVVGAFVARFRGRLVAYLNRCAHVAMEMDWQPGHFFDPDAEFIVCSTHGALYDPASGACAGGPCAGRGGLRKLEVFERDGRVFWVPDVVYRPPPD